MTSFLLRRLSTAVLILLILSFVIFLLQSVSPGDPARAYVGANASNEMVAAERQRLGLNDPMLEQFGRFLGGLDDAADVEKTIERRAAERGRQRHLAQRRDERRE